MNSRVLVVEDEPAIAELIALNLRHAGHEAVVAASADAAQAEVDRVLPDIVLLDWMLPGESGLALARRWRGDKRTRELPIIMLTARAEESERIVGLELGADDYMPKPFNPRELLARIKSVLRRHRTVPDNLQPDLTKALHFAGWTLDLASRNLVSRDQVVVALSGAEFRLLRVFLAYPNRVLSRDQLMDLTVGREADPLDRSVDVQVSRLRQRLGDDAREPDIIKTVRGEGYVLAAGVEAG
jgi:two-component system OmpR family response regulator